MYVLVGKDQILLKFLLYDFAIRAKVDIVRYPKTFFTQLIDYVSKGYQCCYCNKYLITMKLTKPYGCKLRKRRESPQYSHWYIRAYLGTILCLKATNEPWCVSLQITEDHFI